MTEVIVTVGVSEAIDLALRALLDPGDEVLYHEPCYVSYSPSIALAHGVPVAVPTFAEDNFRSPQRELEKKITPRLEGADAEFPVQSHRRDADPRGAGKNRRALPSSTISSCSPTKFTAS